MQTLCRKRLFYITAAVNFLMAAIYCYLTPLMTDDIIYGDTVAKANSFFDLFAQEYEHYMGHSGRSVAHFILRIFLYIGNKNVFNIVAAAAFTLLGILIYLNVDCRKEYDLRVFIGILLLMWLFDPSISNSVFWETGACNYLFTGTLIMGFITIFRNNYREKKHRSIPFAVGMLLYGIVTGWCNENTSGGLIFFIMLMIFLAWLETKDFSGIRLWMVTGFVGNVIGFLFMVFAPGNSSRSAVKADREAHSGILALAARFLKLILTIKDYYLILIFILVVIAIAIAYGTGAPKKFREAAGTMMLFGFMFFITVFALIAVPEPQMRACYGAGLFLMTGIAEGFAWMLNEGFKEVPVQILGTSIVTILGIILIFTYIDCGADLARIKREFDERDAYLAQVAAEGEEMVVEAPMLRPEWDNRFSMAYVSDISEDKENWINAAYSEHYGLYYIIGVDRESWDKY